MRFFLGATRESDRKRKEEKKGTFGDSQESEASHSLEIVHSLEKFFSSNGSEGERSFDCESRTIDETLPEKGKMLLGRDEMISPSSVNSYG